MSDKWDINLEISKLRDEWGTDQHPAGWWQRRYAKDWTLPQNWTALMQEMLLAGQSLMFIRQRDGSMLLWVNHSLPFQAADEGTSVCAAWLKWRSDKLPAQSSS